MHLCQFGSPKHNPQQKNLLCVAMDTGSSKPKDWQFFFLNLKIKDPESFAVKIIVEYNSSAVSQVHMPISAP